MSAVPHPDSLWEKTVHRSFDSDVNSLAGDHRADVVVVGGGFTGLRAALALAEGGVDTIVLEAGDAGWGASGRSGGQVNPLLPENTPESIVARLGPEIGERLCASALASADELFALIKRYDIQCGARQNGWLRVAHCRSAARVWSRQCESWAKAGAPIETIEGSRLVEMSGSSKFSMGALVRTGGAVQPLSLVHGLAEAALTAGVAIHCSTPAISLHQRTGGWTVVTPNGTVAAETVLLCTNAYTDHLWPGLKYSLVPVTAIQVATNALPDKVCGDILPGGQTISDTRRTILYGRREPEGHFLLGSIGQGGDGWPMDFRRLRREAVRLFPQLSQAEWRYHWGGRIAITEGHMPHLHEPAPGILAGLGYNGRGVAMSNVMGRILAERVLGKDAQDLPFPVTPINPYPLRRFTGLGVPLAIAWMRMRDRLETMTG